MKYFIIVVLISMLFLSGCSPSNNETFDAGFYDSSLIEQVNNAVILKFLRTDSPEHIKSVINNVIHSHKEMVLSITPFYYNDTNTNRVIYVYIVFDGGK